jgi:hypothetical protein
MRKKMSVISVIADIATTLASISVLVALLSLKQEAKNARVQAFFYLHGFLATDTLNASRKHIRTTLAHVPYEEWDEKAKSDANNVCASYDQAGILLSTKALDNNTKKRFLESSWGVSIIDQYRLLSDFLDDNQTPYATGREFFEHFKWLNNEAEKYQKKYVQKLKNHQA